MQYWTSVVHKVLTNYSTVDSLDSLVVKWCRATSSERIQRHQGIKKPSWVMRSYFREKWKNENGNGKCWPYGMLLTWWWCFDHDDDDDDILRLRWWDDVFLWIPVCGRKEAMQGDHSCNFWLHACTCVERYGFDDDCRWWWWRWWWWWWWW